MNEGFNKYPSLGVVRYPRIHEVSIVSNVSRQVTNKNNLKGKNDWKTKENRRMQDTESQSNTHTQVTAYHTNSHILHGRTPSPLCSYTSESLSLSHQEDESAHLFINLLNPLHIHYRILLVQPRLRFSSSNLLNERFKLEAVSRPPFLSQTLLPFHIFIYIRLLNARVTSLNLDTNWMIQRRRGEIENFYAPENAFHFCGDSWNLWDEPICRRHCQVASKGGCDIIGKRECRFHAPVNFGNVPRRRGTWREEGMNSGENRGRIGGWQISNAVHCIACFNHCVSTRWKRRSAKVWTYIQDPSWPLLQVHSRI